MGNQRFTVDVPEPAVVISAGEVYQNEDGEKFGYPGFSLKSDAQYFTQVSGNSVTQVDGDTKIQTGGDFAIFSNETLLASDGGTTVGSSGNIVIATGAGQGADNIDETGDEPGLNRFNGLDLWEQVHQHELDLKWFLGDGESAWTDALTGMAPPTPPTPPTATSPDWTPTNVGFFSKTAAWTGGKLGVSLRDPSQDIRGNWALDMNPFVLALGTAPANPFTTVDRLKLLAAHPWGITKSSQSYPAMKDFDPYGSLPKFMQSLMRSRDLLSIVVGAVTDTGLIKRASLIIDSVGKFCNLWGNFWTAWNGVFNSFHSIPEAARDMAAAETWHMAGAAFVDTMKAKINKIAWGADEDDHLSAFREGEKASITSDSEPFSVHPSWTLTITCEENADEVTTSLEDVPCSARLTIEPKLSGVQGPLAIAIAIDGTESIISFEGRASDYTAEIIGNRLKTRFSSVATASVSDSSISFQTISKGPTASITMRPLTGDEWNHSSSHITPEADEAAGLAKSIAAYTAITGDAAPLSENGQIGVEDSENLSAVDLKEILEEAIAEGATSAAQFFTVSVADGAVVIESKHAAEPNAPSKIEITADGGLARATGLAGKSDERTKDDWAEGLAKTGTAIGDEPGLVAALPGDCADAAMKMLDSVDEFASAVAEFPSAVGGFIGSTISDAGDIIDNTREFLVDLNDSNKLGLFGADGITAGTLGQHISHARKGFCFIATGSDFDNQAWPTKPGALANVFTKAYKFFRKVEGLASIEPWFGARAEYEDRDLGFRVLVNKDVDMVSGRVASLAAVGPTGHARIIGHNAIELTTMNNIAIAARDATSSVEVLGGNIYIGAANATPDLKPTDVRFAKVEHEADKERVTDTSRVRPNQDVDPLLGTPAPDICQDMSKKLAATEMETDGEPITVKAWGNENNKVPEDTTFAQKATRAVAVTAKEASTIVVGKYTIVTTPEGISAFGMKEPRQSSPAADGWTRPTIDVDNEAGPVLDLNDTFAQLRIHSNDAAKCSSTFVMEKQAAISSGGAEVVIEPDQIIIRNKDKKGLLIDGSGLTYLDGSTKTPLFDGKKLVAEIDVTTVPKPAVGLDAKSKKRDSEPKKSDSKKKSETEKQMTEEEKKRKERFEEIRKAFEKRSRP